MGLGAMRKWFYLLFNILFISEREREREAETQAEGEAVVDV